MNENKARLAPGDPVTSLPGVGVRRAETLSKLEIRSIEDLIRHYPKRYEDRRQPTPVNSLRDGEAALVRVCVRHVVHAPSRKYGGAMPRIPMKVVCGDDSGEMTLLFFNARYLAHAFREGAEYWVYGTARVGLAGVSMAHPDFDEAAREDSGDGIQAVDAGAGIVPVYPLTAGLTQKFMRTLIRAAIPAVERMDEFIPEYVLEERRLAPIGYALKHIHFPEDGHALNAAKYRLIYEELFLLQAKLLYARGSARGANKRAPVCVPDTGVFDAAGLFDFELTGAQRRVIEEIRLDMSASAPMNRLLQGDVGSGKTAVAAAAAMFAAGAGLQAAIMAPTEILAAQHFLEFERLFLKSGIRTALLTASISAAQRRETLEGLKTGEILIVTGTHALIGPEVVFHRLGLVVTDEQHRFGVRQRLRLREKGEEPDALVMTATPIPRTLALMLYADLDVSILDEAPPGRKPVSTRFIDSSKRDAAYEFAEREMNAGRQVYVVAPSIGDGEDAMPDEADRPLEEDALKSAVGLFEELTARFPHRRVGLMHGRMKSGQKDESMRAFAAGETDLLVSTVVIEVGVNVPNATLMVIENSERFGLAQLHQLRGRVGRGAAKSYCVLISDSKSELSVKRGETLALEHDGLRIAELDLTLRGPGDLFGVRQHGLPELRLADPVKHIDILQKANNDAQGLLKRDPGLMSPEHTVLRRMV